jgi:hypothetical protein
MPDTPDNDAAGSTPPAEERASSQGTADGSQPAEDPGYLTTTGEVVGEDGSVAPIIGGLPAVEGSAWDIGAAAEDRGEGLADELGGPAGEAGHRDTRGG